MKKLTFILLFGLIIAPVINLNSYPFESVVKKIWNSSRTTKAVVAVGFLAGIAYRALNSNTSHGRRRPTRNGGSEGSSSVQPDHYPSAAAVVLTPAITIDQPDLLSAASELQSTSTAQSNKKNINRVKGTIYKTHNDIWGIEVISNQNHDLVRDMGLNSSQKIYCFGIVDIDGYPQFKQDNLVIDMNVEVMRLGVPFSKIFIKFISEDNQEAQHAASAAV